jgi:lysophospholipase L1-like esterase
MADARRADPVSAPPDEAEVQRALRQLAIAGGVVLGLAILPYTMPRFERLRPWEPGEGVPIARLFEAPGEPPITVASGEPTPETSPQVAVDPSILAAAEEPETATPEVPPHTGVVIDPEEYAGLPREIEDTHGAMRAFYASLHRTAVGEPVITHVEHFGDSTIALDGITMTVRERLQQRFGDAGHGFVLGARGHMPYRHHQVRHESDPSWRISDITHLSLSDGRYGLGGALARSSGGAETHFETADEDSPVGRAVSRFEVLYQRHAHGGRLTYRIDDGEPTELDTRAADGQTSDDVLRVDVPEGEHRLTIRSAGHGESRLYGVVLEHGDHGVVYDSLGMVGARAARMLGFDPAHLRGQLAARDASLVVIAFGGNDADDERDLAEFTEIFRNVAHLVREARPEASCLLMAPLDQAERDERGTVRTLGPVPRIVEAMRAAADAEGCAFFDTWSAMGGEGSMGRWYRSSPRLSSSDFRHATPAGYRVIGETFYRALLAGFARYEGERE